MLNNAPKIALGFSCIASEWSALHRQCEAPFARINLMVGPGWGPANAWPVKGIYHGPICLPIPINTVSVGFGKQEIFLRPSPWCNPFVYFTGDEQEAFSDELIRELVTSGAMTNEYWEFLLHRLAKIPSQICQVLHCGTLPQHLQFTIKHNQPGQNPGQGFALKCGHFNVGVFGICFQTTQFCHIPSDRQVGKWLGHWMPISIQISTYKTLYFSLWLWVYCRKGE